MKLKVSIPVNASKEKIWQAITDIENAQERIPAIEEVKIHHQPDEGVIGLKWTETRTLFGKSATETMWITEAEENHYYQTRAESHGSVYQSTMRITEDADGNHLSMEFSAQPQTVLAKILSFILGPIMKNATKKALLQDLKDIKYILEK